MGAASERPYVTSMSDGLVALAGCRIARPAGFGGGVEVVVAEAAPRGFDARVNDSLGVCLKLGPAHAVRSDGRALVYPADAVCVRAPGCVWSCEVAAVGFVSIDIAAHLLPPDLQRRPMQFLPAESLDLKALLPLLEDEGSSLAQQGALSGLIEQLFGQGIVVAGSLREESSRARVVGRARDYLRAHFERNPSLDELAEVSGINRFVLLRYFKQELGVAPHGYLIRLRIERARELLAKGEAPIDVATAVGFADQGHLNRHFGRVIGITPGAYARQVRRFGRRRPS